MNLFLLLLLFFYCLICSILARLYLFSSLLVPYCLYVCPCACCLSSSLSSLTSRAQIIYSFSSFVSSVIFMTLLLTPKFNLVCYSNLPCQVLCFSFSLSPPTSFIPLPSASYQFFPEHSQFRTEEHTIVNSEGIYLKWLILM